MKAILRFLKAVFNFVVGDWILLLGVVAFGGTVAFFRGGAFLNSWTGPVVFVLALILVLALSLFRETWKKH